MAKFKRADIKKMILKEMRMIGMGEMDMLNMPRRKSGCGGDDDYVDDDYAEDLPQMLPSDPSSAYSKGNVSREDCCEAVRCLVECCSCPVTVAALMECCDDILAGKYDK